MFKLSISEEEYQSWKNKNTDGYGAYTFKCAEKWAELMEEKMSNGIELSNDIIRECSHNSICNDSTGAQMAMALSILIQCWEHGNKLPDSIYGL